MTGLQPGGARHDPAISVRGETLTYADLARRIARAPVAAMTDITGLALPDALAAAFAAARAGTAVRVRNPATSVPAGDRWPALPEDTWLVAATSGTTRPARWVTRTAASWAASMTALTEAAGLGASDTVASTGPLHATLHLHAAIHTLVMGGHLTDDPLRATAAHCVPAVLETILRNLPPGAPLRRVVVAGEALPERTARAAAGRAVDLVEYYGAAELSFVGVRRLPQPLLHPFPAVAVRIDPQGTIGARSEYLAQGHLVREASGRWEFRPLPRDRDGYATVGDLATAPTGDASCGFSILGRGEGAITTGGFTVLAREVEVAVESVPGVRAAAVVGIPHPRLGQLVTAAVELEPGTDLAVVRAAARRLLTGPHRPRRYVAVDSLPRVAGGKIARGVLLDLLTTRLPRPAHTTRATEPDRIP